MGSEYILAANTGIHFVLILKPNSGHQERCLFTKYKKIPFIPYYNMAFIMTLWIGNGAVLKSSGQ